MTNTQPLERLDAERFRQDLAGLLDDGYASERERSQFRELAERLLLLLARHYNRQELEVVKLWERIATALQTACEQVDDGDLDRLVTLCLDHVRARVGAVAADPWSIPILAELAELPESTRLAFITYLREHLYAVLIYGRQVWETNKQLTADAQESEHGEEEDREQA